MLKTKTIAEVKRGTTHFLFRLVLGWFPMAFLTVGLAAQEFPPEILNYSDLILYNGRVLTMDRDQPPISTSSAVSIREGRIQAVGQDDRILSMAGPETHRVDLAGRTVLPGIVDTHSHPNSYALSHYEREWTPIYLKYLQESNVLFANIRWDSKEMALEDFQKLAERADPEDWILTRTRSNPVVLQELNRDDLDRIAPNNPVYIRIGNGMFGVANTRMLKIITDRYGENLAGIVRDSQGKPIGVIRGAAGTVVDQEVLPQPPPEALAPILKKELEEWVALGVTTLSTRLNGGEINAYGYLERRGELPLRLGYSHEVGRENPFLDRDLKRLGNLQGHGTPWMWMIGISVGIPDGNGPASQGRACTTLTKKEILPTDLFPDGLCFWEMPDEPGAESILAASRHGYRISGTHTFGDRGFLMILDAYQAADQERPIEGRRFALDHGLMVSPEVLKRAAEAGVMWSLQPPQFYGPYAAGVSRVYGEEYAHQWVMPVKSMIDAGMRVTYGADTHKDPERSPMFGLEVLVTRRIHDGRVFGSKERVDRASALLMMTRWASEYLLRRMEVGSLEAGKLADLVVLDKNPLDPAVRDEDLSDIRVLATVIDGKVVFGSLEN